PRPPRARAAWPRAPPPWRESPPPRRGARRARDKRRGGGSGELPCLVVPHEAGGAEIKAAQRAAVNGVERAVVERHPRHVLLEERLRLVVRGEGRLGGARPPPPLRDG